MLYSLCFCDNELTIERNWDWLQFGFHRKTTWCFGFSISQWTSADWDLNKIIIFKKCFQKDSSGNHFQIKCNEWLQSITICKNSRLYGLNWMVYKVFQRMFLQFLVSAEHPSQKKQQSLSCQNPLCLPPFYVIEGETVDGGDYEEKLGAHWKCHQFSRTKTVSMLVVLKLCVFLKVFVFSSVFCSQCWNKYFEFFSTYFFRFWRKDRRCFQ